MGLCVVCKKYAIASPFVYSDLSTKDRGDLKFCGRFLDGDDELVPLCTACCAGILSALADFFHDAEKLEQHVALDSIKIH